MNVILVFLVLCSTTSAVPKALYSDTFGICEANDADLAVNVSVDLAATPACSFCSDLFDSVVLNVKNCEEAECDGLLCYRDSVYIASASFRPPSDRCVKDDILEDNCDICDSECITICDQSKSYLEEDLVTCAYDLSLVGTTDCCPHGLCTGSVPSQFCDNAVADNRTCFIARIERGIESFSTKKCAPVFASVYGYIGKVIDYWACPMDVAVTTFGESMNIYQTSPEYCTIFEGKYGEEMDYSNTNGTGGGTSNDGGNSGGSLSSWVM